MIKLQRQLNLFNSKTDLLILEVEMLMSITLMPDGTNFSNMMAISLSMKEDKFLQFKVKVIRKIDKLLEKVKITKNTKDGEFFMLMKLNLNQLLVLLKDLDFGLIDHSILCQH